MKQKDSVSIIPPEYRLKPQEQFPYKTLIDAALILQITPQRLSRLLRSLRVPVHRVGYTIFLDDEALSRIRQSLRLREVRPGRKKKSVKA